MEAAVISLELEKAVCVALLGGEIGIEQVDDEDFSRIGQQVHRIIQFLRAKGSSPPYDDDAIVLAAQHLDGRLHTGEIAEYLASLPADVPKEVYLILEQAKIRKGLTRVINVAGEQLATGNYDRSVLENVLDRISFVSKRSVSIADVGALKTYVETHSVPTMWPTGIAVIDAQIGGIRPGELAVIAAPPKTGKTTFLCGQASVALRRSGTVLYITVQDLSGPEIAALIYQIGGDDIFKGQLYVSDLSDRVATLTDVDAAVGEISGGLDVLIVDRAEELSSYRDSDHVRFEYRRIYTALRSLARRKKLVCWVDAQAGVLYDNPTIDFAALAEEKTGRAAILDLFFGMHRDGDHLTLTIRGRRRIDEPRVQCLLTQERRIVSL